MIIDLHSHTYYSDGKFSPAELINAAAQKGVNILAITDHDNTNGVREAIPLAKAAGIQLIPGIELTTRWPGARLMPQDLNVDVLGYFIDLQNAEFRAFEEAALNDIHTRMEICCKQLTAYGYPLSMKDGFAENPRYVGAMQLIWAILHKGYAPSWREAAFLLDMFWLSSRETPFTITAAIEQIHLAGGVAVLAHPSIVRPRGEQMTAADLRKLVEAGLDGIEIFHRRLDDAAREHFLGLAKEFNLLISGGSDLHGWNREFDDLGQQPVTLEMFEALQKKSRLIE